MEIESGKSRTRASRTIDVIVCSALQVNQAAAFANPAVMFIIETAGAGARTATNGEIVFVDHSIDGCALPGLHSQPLMLRFDVICFLMWFAKKLFVETYRQR